MNVLETEWWTLLVPNEWWAESEEDTILVGDRDDVGCIELSTLHKEQGGFGSAELNSLSQEESPEVSNWSSVRVGDFSGIQGAFTEDDAAIREWYVANGAMLLYITYSCDSENSGLDDAAVDEILGTLAVSAHGAGPD